MSIETYITQIKLEQLAQVKRLKLPVYQRAYSWGALGKATERSATVFLDEFLLNSRAADCLGALTVHTTQHCGPLSPLCADNADVYIDDGQHRVVTLVMLSLAVTELLPEAARPEVRAGLTRRNDVMLADLLRVRLFDSLASLSVECRIRPADQEAVDVAEFLTKSKQEHALAAAALADVVEQRKALKHQRGEASAKRALLFKKEDLLHEEIRALQETPVYSAYLQLRAALKGDDWGDFIGLVSQLHERMRRLNFGLFVHQPAVSDQALSLSELAASAYSYFYAQNGATTPVPCAELALGSLRNHLPTDHTIFRYIEDKGDRFSSMKILGLQEPADYLPLFMHQARPEGDEVPLGITEVAWVQRFLANVGSAAVLREADHQVRTLDALYEFGQQINALPEPLRSVWAVLMHVYGQNSTPRAYIARVLRSDDFDVTSEQDLWRLAKVLVGLILVHLKPTNGQRMRAEAAILKLNTLEGGTAYVRNALGATSWEAHQGVVASIIAGYTFGATTVGRSFGKLMLLLADANSPGSTINLSTWAMYHYEHIVPQSSQRMRAVADLTEAERENLDRLYLEDRDTIHCIGNAALLQDQANKALQNHPPRVKLERTRQGSNANAWWGTHLQDLERCQGDVTPELVKERALRIGYNVAAWLADQEMQRQFAEAEAASSALAQDALCSEAARAVEASQAGAVAKAAVEQSHSDKDQRQRAPARTLRVRFHDGTVFEGNLAAEVFAHALAHIGLERVAACGRYCGPYKLISPTAPVGRSYVKVGDKYVFTNGGTEFKERLLKGLAADLGVRLTVEVVDRSPAPKAAA